MASTFFRTELDPLSVHRLQYILETKSSPSSSLLGCRLWDGEKDRYGYGVHRHPFDGKRVRLLVHRLAYYLSRLPTTLSPTYHVSHLCHQNLCINTDHLSYEPQSVNSKRNQCKLEGECTGHRGYKRCVLQ